MKFFQGHGIVAKNQAGLESVQRRQCRVGEARSINGDVAAAGEDRARNRSANGNIERHIAVKLFNRGNELPQEIHGTARQADRRLDWRALVKRARAQYFAGVERHCCRNTDGLNFRLLQFTSEIELISSGVRRKTKCSWIKIR